MTDGRPVKENGLAGLVSLRQHCRIRSDEDKGGN